MKKRYVAMFLGLTLGVTVLTGCSGSDSTQKESVQETQNEEVTGEETGTQTEEADVYGEVSAVKENSITIKIGTMKEMQKSDREEEKEDSDSKHEKNAEDEEVPQMAEGEKAEIVDGEMPSMLDLTGGEEEIVITEDTVIVRMNMRGGKNGGAMMERPDGDENGEMPEKPDGDGNGEMPEKPDGDENGEMPEKPDGDENGEMLEKPDGDGNGEMPERPNGGNMENEEIKISDISEGDTVAVVFDEDGNAEKITVMTIGGMGQPGGAGENQGVESYDAVNAYTSDTDVKGEELTSEGKDENAVHVSEGANVTLKNVQISRNSAESTGGDNSSFYGVGAAALATDGALYISDSTINTDAAGGAGAFAYGSGTVYIADSTITTKQDTSGGIHAAGGGSFYAWDLEVETNGESSAAIRSDRGGGKMVIDEGTYISNGTGSPAIYSTADIAVNESVLQANASEAICIEGLNSIHLYDCDLSGNMSDDSRNDCTWNVILYQSMSGDSQIGNSTFEMEDGTLTAGNGGMFYTTNTESTITLSDVELVYAEDSEFFLKCTGNANERGWGKTGANGADCLFTAIDQEMEGDVIWDSISKLDFYMTQESQLTGAVKQDESYAGDGGDGYCNMIIGEDAVWTVTGDCTLSSLSCEGTIEDANGKTVTIKGTDGTVYQEGDSSFTITVDTYSEQADLSGASTTTAWSAYEVEKTSELE